MSRAISRESFNELKNYLGVYMQQGRVILDSDWNENQDIAVSFVRRMGREALGDGSPNRGFAIDPPFPPPPSLILKTVDTTGMTLGDAIGAIVGACLADLLSLMLYIVFGPLLFFLNFAGDLLESFESLTGFQLSSTQGRLRIARDRPYHGRGFLRLSGHPGTVTITKTLPALRDLSSYDLATFRFRLNEQIPGTFKFFIEDAAGNRSVWEVKNSAFAKDFWLAGFASPLDISFRILTTELPAAVATKSYSAQLSTFAGTAPMTWAVTVGALPAGVSLAPAGTGEESRGGRLSGTSSASGTFSFTVEVTDADGKKVSRAFTLQVKAVGETTLQLPGANEFLSKLSKTEAPTGTPANLAQVRRYGFEVYQNSSTPLVWDFDDLRLGSNALQQEMGDNNFIVRGSEFAQFLNQLTLLTIFQSAGGLGDGGGGGDDDDDLFQNILSLINTDFELDEPSIENAGRLYVAGMPCVQVKDVMYSDQADPNDAPLAPPAAGVVRKDSVYLDVWTEPVTYVEDPEIREVALGGPDTTTRMRVRHRVRVAQGGPMPRGNGVGRGTLATEGSYTAQANRLYRVEIDTPGNIGAATFRWSEDNASTIQRIIEALPPGSTRVSVEDASAFHPGDFVLIRKEFGSEEHRVAAVFGNVITLQAATGTQLAALPAAARVANFTTFALEDSPRIERWSAFKVAIPPDPDDATVSASLLLNDGVRVRFGGREMLRGDYWNFRTRFLSGDASSGLNPDSRVEQLDFVRARGVVHHYAPLAILTRDGSAEEPEKIFQIEDRRNRVGNAGTIGTTLGNVSALTGTAKTHIGSITLPMSARDSKFVIFWSGDLFLPAQAPVDSTLKITAAFYNDQITDPTTDPDTGKIQDRELSVNLRRKPAGVEVPLQLMFAKSDTPFLFLPISAIPTSVHLFVELSETGFSVELANMRVTVLELKKSY
jgi:hypothetical protein